MATKQKKLDIINPPPGVPKFVQDSGVILNIAQQARAPSKDWVQLLVDKTHVIVRIIKVSLHPTPFTVPKEYKETYEEFLEEHHSTCQGEISRVFNVNTLEYVKRLVQGQIDYLCRLPDKLLIRIMCYLDLTSINNMTQCSKKYQKLCESDKMWKALYADHHHTPITPELESFAEAVTWKKIFFMNKTKLQVQLRRMSLQEKEARSEPEQGKGDQFFVTE